MATAKPRLHVSVSEPAYLESSRDNSFGFSARISNTLHGCLDVAFADDPMRARTGYSPITSASSNN